MLVEAGSLRRGGGAREDREQWTEAMLTQFRYNISSAEKGHPDARKRLEGLLLDAQRLGSKNPFVSCTFSASEARNFANEGDTSGYILTIEGPWLPGVEFGFLRARYGLYSDVFDKLQEYGIAYRLEDPYRIVRVQRVDDAFSQAVTVFP